MLSGDGMLDGFRIGRLVVFIGSFAIMLHVVLSSTPRRLCVLEGWEGCLGHDRRLLERLRRNSSVTLV